MKKPYAIIVRCLYVLVALFLLAIIYAKIITPRYTSQNPCINNMRCIDGAKEQWAMAENKTNGDDVVIEKIVEYLDNDTMPTCPQGGVYKVNVIGAHPECTYPGHIFRG